MSSEASWASKRPLAGAIDTLGLNNRRSGCPTIEFYQRLAGWDAVRAHFDSEFATSSKNRRGRQPHEIDISFVLTKAQSRSVSGEKAS